MCFDSFHRTLTHCRHPRLAPASRVTGTFARYLKLEAGSHHRSLPITDSPLGYVGYRASSLVRV
jgi:hypothetical protein